MCTSSAINTSRAPPIFAAVLSDATTCSNSRFHPWNPYDRAMANRASLSEIVDSSMPLEEDSEKRRSNLNVPQTAPSPFLWAFSRSFAWILRCRAFGLHDRPRVRDTA